MVSLLGVETVRHTRYAKTPDGFHIAFQVVGDGPVDIVFIPGWLSHVEALWDDPLLAHSLRRLASFSRLIVFDKRGVGLSDPVQLADLPSVEQWAEDVVAVMDAAASKQAVIFGTHQGGVMALVFAATFPSRTSALVLVNTFARLARAPDYPPGIPQDLLDEWMGRRDADWGVKTGDTRSFNPSLVDDERSRESALRYERLCASPGTAMAMRRMVFSLDVRAVLPVISAPTLVLHRVDASEFRVGHGRYLADHIPTAKYVELPGADSTFFVGDADALLDEVEEFVTGTRSAPDPDRVLTTVLFTDVASSTEHSASVGDRRWRDLLDAHDALAGRQLARYGGRIVKTTGDGLLAAFDGPARAIKCACAIRDALRALGLVVRAGIHTGEVEVRGTDLAGIAVHLAYRVQAKAAPGEVVVSRTVVDLVAGSGIEFDDRGEHELKGIPGKWRLFTVNR